MRKQGILFTIGLLLSGCNNNMSSISSSIQTNTYEINGPTSIGVGEVVVYSIDYQGEVLWSSSDPLVLDINSNGEAVTYKEGIVIITANDNKANILDTIEVNVINQVSLPTNNLEISNLFSNAISLENEVSTNKLEITSSSINQVYVQEAKMYDGFYINQTSDVYENYSGKHNETSTDFIGIKGEYFYDISDNNTNKYGIKRKVVSSNPTNYEILESEAKKRAESPKFINSFYNKLVDMWGARTLDLEIETIKNEEGFTLNLSNIYLFVWANGIDNDSKFYEASLNFANDGYFISGTYTVLTYEDSQYDVQNEKWKDNATIKSTETYTYSSVRGEKLSSEDVTFIPEDYFVKSVISASYEPSTPLTIGSRIRSDFIVLKEYESATAVDTKNILITGVKNINNQVVIIEDTTNGGYEIVSSGSAYLICQMMYSSDVTFLVEVTVN